MFESGTGIALIQGGIPLNSLLLCDVLCVLQ